MEREWKDHLNISIFNVTNHFVIFDFLIIKNYSHVIKDFWNRLT